MTVGELKQLLANVPDDYDVTIFMDYAVEALWQDIDMNRTGWRGAVAALVDPAPNDYRENRPLHSWAASGRVVMWKGKPFGEFRIANGNHCPSLGGKNDQPKEADEPQRLLLPPGKGIVPR